MMNLSLDITNQIYAGRFWAPIHGDDLPLPLAMVTLDAEVMSGLGGIDHNTHVNHERAAGWLQEAVGAFPDGVIGPGTLAAAHACDMLNAINKACDLRLAFLKGLPIWPTFGGGWTTRVEDTRTTAIAAIPQVAA